MRYVLIKDMIWPMIEEKSKGLYASFRLLPDAASKLHEFVANVLPEGIELQAESSYHITTVYSRKFIEHEPDPYEPAGAVAVGYEYLGREGDDPVIAMLVMHPKLYERHATALAAGATHDFAEYIPHITLTKKLPNRSVDLESLPLPNWHIQLGVEAVETLKEHLEAQEYD